jgi:hypothetical protein
MSLMIELSPDEQARLAAAAKQGGMAPEELARKVNEGDLLHSQQRSVAMFTEGFELVVVANGTFDPDTYEYEPEVQSDILRDIGDSDLPVQDARLVPQGYGYGADGPALGLILGGVAGLFLLGKSINENLEAWISIGSRLGKLVSKLRKKHDYCTISEPIAAALALAMLLEEGAAAEDIRFVSTSIHPVINGSLTTEAHDEFLSQPDRYYVFVIEERGTAVHVIGMSSVASLLFHHRLTLADHTEFPGLGSSFIVVDEHA